MILKDGTDWQPEDKDIFSWQHAYPDVDVYQELDKMAVWLDANPGKRKTRTGMKRFCSSWISRANDRGGSSPMPYSPKSSQDASVIPLRDWTTLDDATHNFLNDPAAERYFIERYGQCMTYEGKRITECRVPSGSSRTKSI